MEIFDILFVSLNHFLNKFLLVFFCVTVLCDLKNLKLLNLSSNRLVGSVPSCFCNLKSLRELDLSSNFLQGDIPSCFGSFKSLTGLNLFKNNFRDDFSSWMCSLQSLTKLQFSYDIYPGSIPACLSNLHSFKYLQLGGSMLIGIISSSIFHNLTNLTTLRINSDRLEGTLKFSVFANLSRLKNLEISSNGGLEIDTETPISWRPSFQLSYLSVSDCIVNKRNGGRLPTFLWTQKRIETLFLKGTSIRGTPPLGLFCNSSLSSLDLRRNNISSLFGLPCCNASKNALEISLSDNDIYGSIPENIGHTFPRLNIFRMARNRLRGHIPTCLGNRPLFIVDLSDNSLSGKLPDSFTRNQTLLHYFDVSYNQFQGEMLPVDAYMPQLRFLIINNNRFTGSLLQKLSNFSLLFFVDAGYNYFTENLLLALPLIPFMNVLSLRENHFQGYIPGTLCQMQYLQILDLSGNNLSGKIPLCLNNISSWTASMLIDTPIWMDSSLPDPLVSRTSKNYIRCFNADVLYTVTFLDLSSNKIDGVIPLEIGELKSLRSLNLSNNHIQGSIPISMANMDLLECLDLSHNRLSGSLPKEIAQLISRINSNLAFNNLSGIIPSPEQFPPLETSLEGNQGLCGQPLERICSSNTTRDIDNSETLDVLFYMFCELLFFLGFWGFLASLFFNLRWRMMYFKIIDALYDMYARDH